MQDIIKLDANKILSLKWKALILLSLVLLTVNTLFYVLHARALEHTFEQNRSDTHTYNRFAIKSLIAKSSLQLQQIGELIPALAGIRNTNIHNKSPLLSKALDNLWPSLHVDLNIDYLALFDANTKLKYKWGDSDNAVTIDAELTQTIAQVTQFETPVSIIKCTHACLQLSVMPLISRGESLGVLIIGQYLASLVLDFKHRADTDIGIIVFENDLSANESLQTRFLRPWNATLFAISHANQSVNILQAASKRYTTSAILDEARQVTFGGKFYEVSLEPFDRAVQQGMGYMVLVEDISGPLTNMKQAKLNTLLIGIFGLILSESALLLILWSPLSKLKHTVHALPLLAKSKFKNFRTSVIKHHNPHLINDETDLLIITALELAQQLEELNNTVDQQTNLLADNMSQLKQEMNFVRRLLDVAQVMIITQNQYGKIILVNKYGRNLTGYSTSELASKNFIDLLDQKELANSCLGALHDVAKGGQNHYRDEAGIKCKNGQVRNISWIHSHLHSVDDNGPVILSVGSDITDRKIAEQRISWLADHDSLTGLYNRRRFNELFLNTLKMSSRYKHSGALIFLDMDNFKTINDTQGHHTGDIVIQQVANTLKLLLRDTDIIARLGGDEFAIALHEIDNEGVIRVAKNINQELNKLCIPGLNSLQRLSASIGISHYPQHGSTVNELLSNADIAMYLAKERGRGCWHIFSDTELAKEKLENQVYWQHKIESALDNDEFLLHFQPIVNLQDNSISHYEALIRMRGSNEELIAPAPFIEVAEKTGLIREIDHWVLRHTMEKLDDISMNHTKKITLAINLSAHAFSDQSLLPLLTDLFRKSNINTENIIIEITETAALTDFSAACELITSIKQLGCYFALDDFGVGFASFYYLQQLPVDYIKIDGAFVRQLSQNRNNQILVKAITDVARGFGKKTIAEYVEDEDTLNLLKEYNVDYAQGYYLGKPAERILQ